MILLDCNDVVFKFLLYPIKNFLNLLLIICPILLIISLVLIFIKIVTNPDDKKIIKRIANSCMALVFIFFIPLLVNVVMSVMGDSTDITKCWNNSFKNKNNVSYIPINGSKTTKIVKEEKYEKGELRQLKFTYKGNGSVKSQFSDETMRIVEVHINDFNYNTFNSFMSSQGGADKYIQGLGGVFKKYYGYSGKVSTVYEFQQVSEYVFGLMTIYGFDYYNGSKYCKWGGSCDPGSVGTSDAFYPGNMKHTSEGLSEHTNFDSLITGRKETNMTTNCNWTVDMVYNKAGIYSGGGGSNYSSQCSRGKSIKSVSELKVGDIVHFFNNSANKDIATGSGWYHVAYIGEVYDDHVVGYDGGSYFTNNRNFKWEAKKTDTKLHGTENWIACRIVDLK